MAEMPVGYAANSITDREVENITRSGISTVITTPSDLHKNVEKQRHFDLMDVKKETPSPLLVGLHAVCVCDGQCIVCWCV
jgi:hypothetical protein